jgi:chromate reductase, NAD(P)H dehydrogenase (quinone)
MPHSTRLLFIAGSAREGSFNKRLAQLASRIAEANGIAATFADVADYPMPLYDGDLEAREGAPENAKKLKALMQLHPGVFIATPEYNASITPLLKNTLDWISRIRAENEAPLQVYRTRVFALASASPGGFGGMRSLLALRQVLELGLGALVLPDQVAVARAREAFDEHGHLKDKGQQERLKGAIVKLARAAKLLHGEA